MLDVDWCVALAVGRSLLKRLVSMLHLIVAKQGGEDTRKCRCTGLSEQRRHGMCKLRANGGVKSAIELMVVGLSLLRPTWSSNFLSPRLLTQQLSVPQWWPS